MNPWLWMSLVLPFVLLGMLVVMEYLERVMRRGDISDELALFLDHARPEEVERFVRDGYAPAIEEYWRRTHRSRAFTSSRL